MLRLECGAMRRGILLAPKIDRHELQQRRASAPIIRRFSKEIPSMAAWTHVDGESLYNVQNWGRGYFRINPAGNVEVTPEGPDRPDSPGIDVHELIGQIKRRGIATPVLLRFDGILRSRVRELNNAFNAARAEFNYQGAYRGVFPIKVNQQRHVVEALLEEGQKHGTGLEVGSKPELLAAIAMQAERKLKSKAFEREYPECRSTPKSPISWGSSCRITATVVASPTDRLAK